MTTANGRHLAVAPYDFLLTFSGIYGSLSLCFRDVDATYVFRPLGRFGHLWWPNGHAYQWVRLLTWGFLLVFYSSHSSKRRCTLHYLCSPFTSTRSVNTDVILDISIGGPCTRSPVHTTVNAVRQDGPRSR